MSSLKTRIARLEARLAKFQPRRRGKFVILPGNGRGPAPPPLEEQLCRGWGVIILGQGEAYDRYRGLKEEP